MSIKDHASQSFISVVAAIIVSPFALWITFMSTNYFKAPELSIAFINYRAELKKYEIPEKTQQLIFENRGALEGVLFPIILSTMSNFQNQEEPLESMILLQRLMQGKVPDEMTPFTACQILEATSRHVLDIESDLIKIDGNMDIVEKKKNSINITEIDGVPDNVVSYYLSTGNQEPLIKLYQNRHKMAENKKNALIKLNENLYFICQEKNLLRSGELEIQLGVLNEGYSTGVIRPYATLKVGGLTIPLISLGEEKYTTIPEKKFIEVKYKTELKAMSPQNLRKWREIINKKSSVSGVVLASSLTEEFEFDIDITPSNRKLYPKNSQPKTTLGFGAIITK